VNASALRLPPAWRTCAARTGALTALVFAALLTGCAPITRTSSAPPPGPLDASRQLVVVTSDDWSSTRGLLQRFERDAPTDDWRPVGAPFPIVLGRTGLAWGRGEHGLAPPEQPRKREGDGKSPAGVFTLGAAFGYAPASEAGVPAQGLAYLQATADTECVDDPASVHYNSLLQRTQTRIDWNSAEHMRRDDDMYRLGIFVDHNTNPAQAGGGSCIFIHIWEGPARATDGCTAADARDIAALLAWLDRSRSPRLVQLPRDEYHAHVRAWRLPPA